MNIQSYTLEQLQAEIRACLTANCNHTYDDYNDMLLMDLLAERDRRLPSDDDDDDSYYGSMALPLKG